MTVVARSIIERLLEAGATLECMDGGRVRFSAPAPLPITLLAEAREHREAIAAALGLGELPTGPCPRCGRGSYWRLSVLSGGPGCWLCQQCVRPDPGDWIDGCATTAGKAGRRLYS